MYFKNISYYGCELTKKKTQILRKLVPGLVTETEKNNFVTWIYEQLQTKDWLEILEQFDESSLSKNPVISVRTPVMIYILSAARELFKNFMKSPKSNKITIDDHVEFWQWLEIQFECTENILRTNDYPKNLMFGRVRFLDLYISFLVDSFFLFTGATKNCVSLIT